MINIFKEKKQQLKERYHKLPMWKKYIIGLVATAIFLILFQLLPGAELNFYSILMFLLLGFLYVDKERREKNAKKREEINLYEYIMDLSRSDDPEAKLAFLLFILGFIMIFFTLACILIVPLVMLIEHIVYIL